MRHKQNSFAFESNFHRENLFDIMSEFKAKNFRTNLSFLFISDIEICKSRVKKKE